MARKRKLSRKRKPLGLSPTGHAQDAKRWQSSAEDILQLAERIHRKNPCHAVEHYTDAIAEGTVAEVQFHQAGDSNGSRFAQRFVSNATRRQRDAVQQCRVHPHDSDEKE